jgi:uncharacterized membrane protein YcjF (UPF0283 family)
MARRKDANSIIETEITDSRLAREFVELSRELDETVPDKPAKILISSVTPRINRKASELKERYKRKREFIAMLLAYILAVPFILMQVLDYVVNGWDGMLFCTMFAIAVFSVLLLACIPLLIKFSGKQNY